VEKLNRGILSKRKLKTAEFYSKEEIENGKCTKS
jgi:hypothetical protein